ncbi:MAG: DUF4406 domain-containing protein [Bacteroidales bacterium]|nr:DUF4406 domain-containing protein [Bacteroidales bacterium]
MEVVYISGKVTGRPWNEVEEQFLKASSVVRHHGCVPVVPIFLCKWGWSWFDCMRVCIGELVNCDKILMLPGWKKSRGARIEWLVALACGIPVLKYKSHESD